MALELRRYADVGEFHRRARPFLAEREAENNLRIRICTTRIAQPERSEPDIYLAEVVRDGTVVAVAVRTPPLKRGALGPPGAAASRPGDSAARG